MSNRDKQREQLEAAEKWNAKVDEIEMDALALARYENATLVRPTPSPMPEMYRAKKILEGNVHYEQAVANRNASVQRAIMYGIAADTEEGAS